MLCWIVLPSKADLNYLAGILDGEGCLDISRSLPSKNRRNPYHWIRVAVSNTDERLIVWLQRTFGGSISKPSKRIGRRQSWAWSITGGAAAVLIREVSPLLIVKSEQADVLLEFAELPRGGKLTKQTVNAREVLTDKLRKLRKAE